MTAAIEQHTVFPAGPAELEPLLQALHVEQPGRRHDRSEPHEQDTAELVGPDGTRVPLPHEVYEVLQQVVAAMAQGQAINIVPRNAVLTTQEAADMLNVSRRDPDEVVKEASDLLLAACDGIGADLLAAGVCAGGWVDPRSGTVRSHPVLGWTDVAMRGIAAVVDVPMFFDSSAHRREKPRERRGGAHGSSGRRGHFSITM
ncbi:hypothetical protein [Prauserella flavalba]|uniref:hypothetical protein n=1 Tax=Prauserella flavalba TaxID=1477506 RepID=UPI0036E26FCF